MYYELFDLLQIEVLHPNIFFNHHRFFLSLQFPQDEHLLKKCKQNHT